MNKKLLQIVTVFFAALVLNACGNEPCKRVCNSDGEHCYRECGKGDLECVEADDWGDPKVWVPASSDDKAIIVKGEYPNQISSAVDSGQVLIDTKESIIAMSVGRRDQWTSWFGGKDLNPRLPSGKPDPSGWDGGRMVPNIECEYFVTNGASPGDIKNDLSPATIYADRKNPLDKFYLGKDKKYHTIGGADKDRALYANKYSPCHFRYGMGLYLGLAPDDGVGRSSSSNVVFTYHLPDAKYPDKANDNTKYIDPATGQVKTIPDKSDTAAYAAYSRAVNENYTSSILNANKKDRGIDGYVVRGFARDELPGAQTGDRLYFKIVDNFYDDNEGGYLVRLKEGTRSPKKGPLETVTGVLLDPVKIIMRRLYEGIISNTEYIQFVRGILALYIVFYGFKFMMGLGSAEEMRKDAVMRILKIAVIVQLISPGSWTFFYNNLFGLFVDGIMNIAGFLMNPFSDYDPKAPWYAADRMLAKFFSAETNAKISSTLLSNIPVGILAFISLYFAMILFIKALVKAVVIYIVAFVAIAILVVLAPIFILFMLFEHTKELLNEWWNQMMAFAVQIILMMAGLGMFAAVIVMFMERTIGYRVCWNIWADFDFIGFNSKNTFLNAAHLFDLRFWMPDISKDMSNLWMDVNGDGRRAMTEFAYRYIDLPYFDPVYDANVIARYMRETNFLQIGDLLIFMAAVWLMMVFMEFVPKLSETLKGGGGTQGTASMFGAGGKLMGSIVDAGKQAFGTGTWAGKGTLGMAGSAWSSRAGRTTRSYVGDGAAYAGKGIASGAKKFGSAAAAGLEKLSSKASTSSPAGGAPAAGAAASNEHKQADAGALSTNAADIGKRTFGGGGSTPSSSIAPPVSRGAGSGSSGTARSGVTPTPSAPSAPVSTPAVGSGGASTGGDAAATAQRSAVNAGAPTAAEKSSGVAHSDITKKPETETQIDMRNKNAADLVAGAALPGSAAAASPGASPADNARAADEAAKELLRRDAAQKADATRGESSKDSSSDEAKKLSDEAAAREAEAKKQAEDIAKKAQEEAMLKAAQEDQLKQQQLQTDIQAQQKAENARLLDEQARAAAQRKKEKDLKIQVYNAQIVMNQNQLSILEASDGDKAQINDLKGKIKTLQDQIKAENDKPD